jgi:hypothetical protein
MTEVFEKVTCDAAGNVTHIEHVQRPQLFVQSTWTIPKLDIGAQAIITDKMTGAVSNGPDDAGEYSWTGPGGKVAKAGQIWADLL